jgi:hypothetical protein
MTGLVDKLKKLEPEFSQVRQRAKDESRNVAKRGGLSVNNKKNEAKGE